MYMSVCALCVHLVLKRMLGSPEIEVIDGCEAIM